MGARLTVSPSDSIRSSKNAQAGAGALRNEPTGAESFVESGHVLQRIFIVLVAIAILGFAALAWRPAIAPISRPSVSNFSPERVAQGEVLAAAGYCSECHTVKGGKPYAGGYAMETGFGTLYSTNITPDPATGIGDWSEEAFRRTMHEGVARDGPQNGTGAPILPKASAIAAPATRRAIS